MSQHRKSGLGDYLGIRERFMAVFNSGIKKEWVWKEKRDIRGKLMSSRLPKEQEVSFHLNKARQTDSTWMVR